MTIAKLRVGLLIAAVGLLVVGMLPVLGGCNGEGNGETPAPVPTGQQSLSGTIIQAGSTSVQPLLQAIATAFESEFPDVTINVGGGGSSHGVRACADGTVDLGAASRDIKMSEADLIPYPIARDAVAIVIHPENPISELTMAGLSAIYAGDVANWSELNGPDADIEVVSREEGSGTRDCFEFMVMRQYAAEITDSAVFLDSNGAVKNKVSSTPSAIGFLSLGYVDSSVKALPLSPGPNQAAIEPTPANCKSGLYPIVRRLYVLTRDEPSGALAAFIDYCRSSEGQQIVAQEGYVPLEKTIEDFQGPIVDGEVAGTIDEAGSTSVQPLAQRMASEFEELHEVTIHIGGGGSTHGVRACSDGTVDLGAASRDIKIMEDDLIPHAIARDAVAIAVHPENTVTDLTLAQVMRIYSRQITNWKEVGGPDAGIEIVSREEGSGTRDCFEHGVMNVFNSSISESAVFLDSNGAVKNKVSSTPNAIGYLSLGYLDETVKNVTIDGVEPTLETCASGEYPVLRRLYLLTREVPTNPVKAFIEFCRSEEGQQIAEEEGYVPLAR